MAAAAAAAEVGAGLGKRIVGKYFVNGYVFVAQARNMETLLSIEVRPIIKDLSIHDKAATRFYNHLLYRQDAQFCNEEIQSKLLLRSLSSIVYSKETDFILGYIANSYDD